jgi:hypothetical protein
LEVGGGCLEWLWAGGGWRWWLEVARWLEVAGSGWMELPGWRWLAVAGAAGVAGWLEVKAVAAGVAGGGRRWLEEVGKRLAR